MKMPARKMAFLALRMTLLPFVLREVFQRRKVTIIVYHAPSADVFDAHLDILKHLYNIVSLSLYVEARQTGTFSKLPPKALIITLDDGHRSNYALKPVIERHNVPVTMFLCSGVIDTRRRFWFQHTSTSGIVQQLKTLPDVERLAILRDAGFEETKEFDDRQALSAAELEELKAKVEFQSHTVFHPILPRCVPARAEAEITESKKDIETNLATRVYALAYPNGDYSERELALVKKAGYRCAVTLDRGFNSEKTPLFRLRRICLSDHADHHELVVKTSGLWGGIRAVLGTK
jgi:peptidoglycan/xylan/chitin deacetylase (PgdA/CDA1 family)